MTKMSFNWAVGRTAKPISTRGADYAHQSTTSPQGFSDLTKGLIPNTTHAAYLRWSYFWRALIKKFHYICLILKFSKMISVKENTYVNLLDLQKNIKRERNRIFNITPSKVYGTLLNYFFRSKESTPCQQKNAYPLKKNYE